MSTVSHAHDHHDDHAHDHPHGWRRWLFATNHKDIGTLYLIFSFVSLMAGGVMALLIRLELFQPGLQFIRPELFNQLTTLHGLVMVFGAIMPAFVGFANYMIPLQVGPSSISRTMTSTSSPSETSLAGAMFLLVQSISDTCTRPSMPGSSSTNAP